MTTLGSVSTTGFVTGRPVFVSGTQEIYLFDSASTDTPDGDLVIQPDVGNGRWLKEVALATSAGGLPTLDSNGTLAQAATLLKESGGQVLSIGAVADGDLLGRSGTTFVGSSPSEGQVITPNTHTFAGDGAASDFTLPSAVPAGLEEATVVARNGSTLTYTASTPTSLDEFTVDGDQLKMGFVPEGGTAPDQFAVIYWT